MTMIRRCSFIECWIKEEKMTIQLIAREYVLMTPKLNYNAIVTHAAKLYAREEERKAFILAVLDADVAISNEKDLEAGPSSTKLSHRNSVTTDAQSVAHTN